MWWHPGSGGSLELLRLASSTSDLIQDVMPLVPDLLGGELEHDEASSAQPLHARGIELLVDEAGVEALALDLDDQRKRSEEHTSELQSLMRISYAVFCLKKKKNIPQIHRD